MQTLRSGFSVVLVVALAVLAFPAAAETWSGTFKGASRHKTSGTVTISSDASGFVVTLGNDFSFDGAPDPKLAFGNARTVDKKTIFAPLAKNAGRQSYRLPASIEPASFSTFYLWCQRFSVPLGTATLARR
jgi:hypothetical protein